MAIRSTLANDQGSATAGVHRIRLDRATIRENAPRTIGLLRRGPDRLQLYNQRCSQTRSPRISAVCKSAVVKTAFRAQNLSAMRGIRHIRNPGWATLLVLGLLFLRALVPAGFMLAQVDGRLAFVLCDAETSAGEHQHQHHHPGHDNATHHEGTHGDPTCPYAQSAGPAPLPTLPVIAGAAAVDQLRVLAAVTQTLLSFGPTRQQMPRGPPVLA